LEGLLGIHWRAGERKLIEGGARMSIISWIILGLTAGLLEARLSKERAKVFGSTSRWELSALSKGLSVRFFWRHGR
jgi:hypothetical protein